MLEKLSLCGRKALHCFLLQTDVWLSLIKKIDRYRLVISIFFTSYVRAAWRCAFLWCTISSLFVLITGTFGMYVDGDATVAGVVAESWHKGPMHCSVKCQCSSRNLSGARKMSHLRKLNCMNATSRKLIHCLWGTVHRISRTKHSNQETTTSSNVIAKVYGIYAIITSHVCNSQELKCALWITMQLHNTFPEAWTLCWQHFHVFNTSFPFRILRWREGGLHPRFQLPATGHGSGSKHKWPRLRWGGMCPGCKSWVSYCFLVTVRMCQCKNGNRDLQQCC